MELVRPPSLAVFLDYGGDLSAFPGLEGLAEAVIVRRRLNDCGQNESHQAFYASCVERWLEQGPAALEATTGIGSPATQATVAAFAWAAECYADPCLAERFERSIPADVYADHIEWAAERRARPAL
jgi:hypothetical protein